MTMEPTLCSECGGAGAIANTADTGEYVVLTCPHCGGGCIEPTPKKTRVRPEGTDDV